MAALAPIPVHGFGVLEIGRVKASGEPIVDRCWERPCVVSPVRLWPPPSEAHRPRSSQDAACWSQAVARPSGSRLLLGPHLKRHNVAATRPEATPSPYCILPWHGSTSAPVLHGMCGTGGHAVPACWWPASWITMLSLSVCQHTSCGCAAVE